MNDATLNIIIRARDEASKAVKSTSGKISSSIKNMASTAARYAKIAAVAVGAAGIAIGGFAIKAAADFETMNVALKTAFQGNEQAARQASAQITDFAKRTPFELGEVMRSFIKLKNMGLDPSEEALTSYGDTASAMGKSLNDMVEAVADAITGEFERLKEFGIRSSSEGDRVKFTFQGVTTEVGKNAEEIEDYLINLGKTNFAGGMEAQSRTFSGMVATLKDTISIAAAEFADSTGLFDAAKASISAVSDTIEDLSNQAIALYDVLVKGDYNKRFFEAFGAHEDSELVDFLFNVREGFLEWLDAVMEVGRQVAGYLLPPLQQLWRTVSTNLIPALHEMWQELAPTLIPVLKFLGTVVLALVISQIKATIQFITFMADVAAGLARAVTATSKAISSAFTWIADRVNWLRNNWQEAIGFVIGYFATLPVRLPFYIFNAIKKVVDIIMSVNWAGVFSGLLRSGSNAFNSVWRAAVDVFNRVRSLDWGSIMAGIGRGIANAIIGMVEGAIKGATHGIPVLGDMANRLHIPRFDNGGVVPGPRGKPQMILAHGGETVLPTHKRGVAGAGVTFNQYNTIHNDIDLDAAMEHSGYLLSLRI